MIMKNSDILRMTMRHIQDIRKTVPNPTDATLAAWRLEDFRHETTLRYYEALEAAEQAKAEAASEEDYTFSITSEVKLE